MTSPADAIIAVTHRCNAHCVMCNVWKSSAADRLRPEHLRKLPADLRTINLTGGEPFCRSDLPEFVRQANLRCPKAQITISTNAYMPDQIEKTMAEIVKIDPAVHLAVSLDGLGRAHDKIRGDEGAFDSAMELIERLTASGFRGLRLSMTLSETNPDQLLGVADLAVRRGLELGVVAAHAARTHLGVKHEPRREMPARLAGQFEKIISRWLLGWRAKQWLRAHFTYNTYRLLAGRPGRFRCRAGRDFFFCQADGTVYSCSVRGRPLGNLTEQNWEQIWSSKAAADARQAARRCPENCWMICTARSIYRTRPWAAAWWIITRKALAHLHMFSLPGAAAASNGRATESSCANSSR
ncbi:MAG: radical SAM protein [Planctomycetota bacterium]|nr:radical SAM protein [Planctomycetota bacterium]